MNVNKCLSPVQGNVEQGENTWESTSGWRNQTHTGGGKTKLWGTQRFGFLEEDKTDK